jgi:adenylate kinase
VGKSTMCARLAEGVGAVHLSSGDLIRQSTTDALRTSSEKPVGDIGRNQDVLIAALAAHDAGEVILDGHFVLLQTNGDIAEVPADIFKELAPVGVLLVVDTPQAIASRLWARDGTRYEETFLAEMQRREKAAADFVIRSIGAPLHIVSSNDEILAVADLVREWLTGSGER